MKHSTNRGALALASLMLLGILLMAGCSKPEPPPAGYYTGPMTPKNKLAPTSGAAAPGQSGAKGNVPE